MSFVLGTAGHVDHGKSVLVKSLTGIDPDRLQEEKERGLTIDLGFAWLDLPSGRSIGIVDVPGHEHFIKNMLAGAGGIDVALLVIAADEGVMPQTKEHLAILDLLQVDKGIAVITKKDIVDEELLELVTLEVSEVLAGTTLAEAPTVAISALTGEGLPELVSTIDLVLDSAIPKKDIGRPRLSIDRVFTMSGFGTVVTGTLVDGSLSKGQEIVILPRGLTARIRGLQSHKHKIDTALPGNRVAVNLSGVTTSQLTRGDVVTTPGWLTPTRAFDVKLRLLPSVPRPLPHSATVTFHHGATEVLGKVRLLDRDKIEPGETTWAQLLLTQSIAAVKDDRFIIRSPQETLGGGRIVGSRAKRHRRFRPDVIEGLVARESGTAEHIILAVIQEEEPIELEKLIALCNLSRGEVKAAIEMLTNQKKVVILGDMELLFSAHGWEKLAKQTSIAVQKYHQQFPLRYGPSKEELRGKLKITTKLFPCVLEQLIRDGTIIDAGPMVRIPDHTPQPTTKQHAEAEAFLGRLARNPYLPSLDPLPEPDLLNLLIGQHQVVKVSDDVIFLTSTFDKMTEDIITHIKSHGKVTVAEVRDLFHTSRKYALALMEYLDAKKITRRIGDERVLR